MTVTCLAEKRASPLTILVISTTRAGSPGFDRTPHTRARGGGGRRTRCKPPRSGPPRLAHHPAPRQEDHVTDLSHFGLGQLQLLGQHPVPGLGRHHLLDHGHRPVVGPLTNGAGTSLDPRRVLLLVVALPAVGPFAGALRGVVALGQRLGLRRTRCSASCPPRLSRPDGLLAYRRQPLQCSCTVGVRHVQVRQPAQTLRLTCGATRKQSLLCLGALQQPDGGQDQHADERHDEDRGDDPAGSTPKPGHDVSTLLFDLLAKPVLLSHVRVLRDRVHGDLDDLRPVILALRLQRCRPWASRRRMWT